MRKPASIPVDEGAAAASSSRLGPGASENSSPGPARGIEISSSSEEQQPREGGQESIVVERRGDFSVLCKWTIAQFPRVKARSLWSKYFQVGGYDCRLLVYPRGDTQALPGYLSIYLQVSDPGNTSSSRWDCFASYRLGVVNHSSDAKSIHRDSWHRFSVKKKSHGWCDFSPSATILDPRSGFLVNDSLLITTEILILSESHSFSRDNELMANPPSEALAGKFTWKVHNFSLFKEMIKTQKIMSPVFSAGECNLRLSVYQSSVAGAEHLSMCLESKDTDKTSPSSSTNPATPPERSCWCLFRMSVMNQRTGLSHMHRDSYGRFAGDNKNGDNTSLGWNDYMKMADFTAPESGYLLEDSAVFCASFHVIKESCSFLKLGNRKKSDGYHGRFVWRIENFTKLKDLLKKRKITGLCIKSRRFQVGSRDCRLIVYPRGQSQPPCHLSMFLEVTDSKNSGSDWSCFVSHRLSVVNQRAEERSVVKESQNRYCKAAKDWGWREFITLTNLFDQDSGFLVQDTVTFSAEVLILKEVATMVELPKSEEASPIKACNRGVFTWKVENFVAFKEIMETRKIFSKFFQAGGCELRIGVYESFDTLCIYLESDQSPGGDPDRNFWVKYRMTVMNQKHPERSVWKESSICTKTWNNSVLQFMKVSDLVDPEAGYLMRDTIIFLCEIQDCCPWFEFADLEVLVSDEEQDAASTDADELLDSDESVNGGDEEDIFRSLLARAGFHMSFGDNPQLLLDPSQLQVTLREKLLMDAGAVAAFLTGLRVYLDDPAKVKRLLLPTKSSSAPAKSANGKLEATSPSLMNLFMGVKVLQQAIVDLLLDIMVECCQPSDAKTRPNGKFAASVEVGFSSGKLGDLDLRNADAAVLIIEDPAHRMFAERLDETSSCSSSPQAVQSSDSSEASAASSNHANELRWPEQSEELLRLIVSSLRAVDGAVPQGCPEPRRRPHSAEKMITVLRKAPKYLQHDLLALVPKLVDPSEHQSAAYSLLDWLQGKDVEAGLRLESFASLVQLDVNAEVFRNILNQAISSLPEAEEDSLPAILTCVFKAATKCHGLPGAIAAVRSRLLGHPVSSKVLDVVRSTICNFPEAGEALLRSIDGDCGCSDRDSPASDSDSGERSQVESWRMIDVDVLVEMLSMPALRLEAQRAFEKAIARGAFGERSVVIVLERRRSERLSGFTGDSTGSSSPSSAGSSSGKDDDFPAILGLAEGLSGARDGRVREFVSTLYGVMFKVYGDAGYRDRMLRGLVGCATGSSSDQAQVGADVLTILVREEEGTARPVLAMMREAVEHAKLEHAVTSKQLRAAEEELSRVRGEKQGEINRLAKEKSSLSQRAADAESMVARIKGDHKVEIDRVTREKREVGERLRDVERQLEWVRSERDEESTKHSGERKSLQDRLREVESQLAQQKARRRDDQKRATKEKNIAAEKLKSAEATCKQYRNEMERLSAESASRSELCQAQQKQLESFGEERERTKGLLDNKDQRLARYEELVQDLKNRLLVAEKTNDSLNQSLNEELARQAPLFGVGLDTLSWAELGNLAQIHEDGLRLVRARQQQFEQRSHLQRGMMQTSPEAYALLHNRNPRVNGSWYNPTP